MTGEHRANAERTHLAGLVTEQHLDLADLEFPGVARFYERVQRCADAPMTFLDLLVEFGVFTPPTRS